jgi:predicted dehydrogenase
MMDMVNVGFIGCGGNARGHMTSVAKVPGAKIEGVCDVVADLAQKAAKDFSAEPYTDHRALLDRKDLHAVYISIPVFAHGKPELDTVARGLPFLVEKPVAIDLETAKKVEKAVKAKKIISYKYTRREQYHRKVGHRQRHLRVRITEIVAP